MDQKKIDRINALARKAKTIGLTAEEQAEQAELRKWYIDLWKRSLEAELAHTYIVTPDGKKHKVTKKADSKDAREQTDNQPDNEDSEEES